MVFLFFISSSGSDEGMGAIAAISVEDHTRNMSVKLF